jgi:hypothetical protein
MKPLDFEIRVTGPVPANVMDEIPCARVVARPVETILRGPVTDQGALHELLNRFQGLGLNLLEVRRLSASSVDAGLLDSENWHARNAPAATGTTRPVRSCGTDSPL